MEFLCVYIYIITCCRFNATVEIEEEFAVSDQLQNSEPLRMRNTDFSVHE